MALNLALCNSFQVNGDDKWCFCFPRRKKKNKRKRKNVSQGQVIHDSGTFIVTPYPEDEILHLIQPEHLEHGLASIQLWNPDKTHLFAKDSNMAVFDTNYDPNIESPNGSDNGSPDITPAVKSFVDASITQTLNGGYVNVIAFWNQNAWHVHTHPISNDTQKVIGCIMITEPFNKPIRMNFNPVM